MRRPELTSESFPLTERRVLHRAPTADPVEADSGEAVDSNGLGPFREEVVPDHLGLRTAAEERTERLDDVVQHLRLLRDRVDRAGVGDVPVYCRSYSGELLQLDETAQQRAAAVAMAPSCRSRRLPRTDTALVVEKDTQPAECPGV